MASTINDTQELEKKKQEINSSTNTTREGFKKIWSFLVSVLITLLYIIIYFILSSIVLYECKLAQCNIVPTFSECYPYTHSKVKIQKIVTDIFITNASPPESVKLSFPYDDYGNSKNLILEFFSKYKEKANANFLLIYIIGILEALANYSNNALTFFFNFLNGFPEILIVLFGPILTIIYFLIIPFIGILVFAYNYFLGMKWFFKKNSNPPSSTNKPVWVDVDLAEPISYFISLCCVVTFCIVFFILLFTFVSIPMFVAFVFYICLFMTFGYKGVIDNKKVSILTIMHDTFKHYKVTISVIFTINIISKAFNILGLLPGIFSILVVLLIYFNVIRINVFKSTQLKNATPLSNFDQAEKICEGVIKHSQNGGGIGKELKKIYKHLSNE